MLCFPTSQKDNSSLREALPLKEFLDRAGPSGVRMSEALGDLATIGLTSPLGRGDVRTLDAAVATDTVSRQRRCRGVRRGGCDSC